MDSLNEKTKGITRIGSITDQELYIDQEEDLNISTLSWASQMDEELGDSIEDFLLCNEQEIEEKCVEQKPKIDIEYILDINFKKKIDEFDDVELLGFQLIITDHLRKEFRNNEKSSKFKPFSFDIYEAKINWILECSKYFSDKLKLKIIQHPHGNKNKPIHRSSYKFCDYEHDCEYNYTSSGKGCYAQHYVHNHIYADLYSLVKYIEHVDTNHVKFSEIIKCLNTTWFVINHMHEELKHIEYFNKGKSNLLHKEITPSDKKKTKKKRKEKYIK